MSGPPPQPLGLQLARTAKVVSRAFDDALAAAGGSLPIWQVLVTVQAGRHGAQRHIAAALGIEGATLTHHLNRLESAGLVRRTRDPANRRVQQVALTDAGEALFHRLRQAVATFDRRLRAGLSDQDAAALAGLLARLHRNVTTPRHAEEVP